jgi:hypothetical protein
VVISHVTGDEIPADATRQAAAIYEGASAPGVARAKAEIARFFDGLDMLDPGLTDVCAWRSDLDHTARPALFYGGAGRKPQLAGEVA